MNQPVHFIETVQIGIRAPRQLRRISFHAPGFRIEQNHPLSVRRYIENYNVGIGHARSGAQNHFSL
jgi:hypothetical protein